MTQRKDFGKSFALKDFSWHWKYKRQSVGIRSELRLIVHSPQYVMQWEETFHLKTPLLISSFYQEIKDLNV